MKENWTKGEWVLASFDGDWRAPSREDCGTSAARMIRSSGGDAVAMAVTSYAEWQNKAKDAELDSNAHLIAAAPKLYEALKVALSYIASRCGTPDPEDRFVDQVLVEVHKQCDKALAAARGEDDNKAD